LKRALRRRFLRSRDPADKSAYRRTEDELMKLLHKTKNDYFVDLIRNADPTNAHGLNLWKAGRSVKQHRPRCPYKVMHKFPWHLLTSWKADLNHLILRN